MLKPMKDQALTDFVFDTLGDMADPSEFEVMNKDGKEVLLFTGHFPYPIEMLHDEWIMAKKGTEFEDVELYA